MSNNRHQRRIALREFRRDASKTYLDTFLIDAGASLDGHPLLSHALSFWRSRIQQRRPFCPNCKRSYADDAHPGAILFSTLAVAPTTASVTVFCDQCWRDLPLTVIEREAVRVLRQVIPNGRFLDQRDTRRR
jgi:hypothetical protein